MTLAEFKAWLDGYQHAFAGASPSTEQWIEIKAKIDSVQIAPHNVTLPPYRDPVGPYLPGAPSVRPLWIGSPDLVPRMETIRNHTVMRAPIDEVDA